jgi:hypothetical protein
MPFSIAAAGIAAGAGIYAANKQSDTAERGQDIAQGQFAQQRTDTAPWRTTGAQALPATADLLGLNEPQAAQAAMGNFQQSPGYQYQLEQGLRSVDAGAAAQGMLRSGATLKAEQAFGDSVHRPYLHLVDGGVSDNVGMRGVLDALELLEALHDAGLPTPLDHGSPVGAADFLSPAQRARRTRGSTWSVSSGAPARPVRASP